MNEIPYDQMRRILGLPDHRPPCRLDDRDANPCTLPAGHAGAHHCEDAYWCTDCEDFHP